MRKIWFLTLALFLSFPTFASLTATETFKSLKGKYNVTLDGIDYLFALRSSGDIKLITTNQHVVAVEMVVTYTSGGFGLMDGLPVAHITLLSASDEDSRDFHILLTAEQSWDDGASTTKLITAFSTFNDGPNDYTSFEGSFDPALKKYDLRTKKYLLVK